MTLVRYSSGVRREKRTCTKVLGKGRAAGMKRGAGPPREPGKVRKKGRRVRVNGPGASCVVVTTLRATAKVEERAGSLQRAASCVGGHTLPVNAESEAKRKGRKE